MKAFQFRNTKSSILSIRIFPASIVFSQPFLYKWWLSRQLVPRAFMLYRKYFFLCVRGQIVVNRFTQIAHNIPVETVIFKTTNIFTLLCICEVRISKECLFSDRDF